VGGHELLLLPERVQKAERVDAEADDPHEGERRHRERRAERHADTLARVGRGEHQKWQHQPGGELDSDAYRQCRRGRRRAVPSSACSRAQGQRRRDRCEHQRVVVGSSHRERERHGVEPDKRRGPAGRATESPRRPRDQRDGDERADDGDRLERP
jgi:hypothetical protein